MAKGGQFSRYLQTNQGLKISQSYFPVEFRSEVHPAMVINYPSSYIQLDVAREKVVNIKDKVNLTQIPNLLLNQIVGFLRTESENLNKASVLQINRIEFLLKTSLNFKITDDLLGETFILKIQRNGDVLNFSIVKVKEIPRKYDVSRVVYWNYKDKNSVPNLVKLCSEFKLPEDFLKSMSLVKLTKKISKHFGEYLDLSHNRFWSKTVLRDEDEMVENVNFEFIQGEELMHNVERLEFEEYMAANSPVQLSLDGDLKEMFREYIIMSISDRVKIHADKLTKTFMHVPILFLKIHIFSSVLIQDYSAFSFSFDFKKDFIDHYSQVTQKKVKN